MIEPLMIDYLHLDNLTLNPTATEEESVTLFSNYTIDLLTQY